MTYEEFEFCYDQASRDLDDQIDSMQEKVERMGAHRRVLDAARDAFSKYDDLREQVDSQQQEIDDLHEQLEAEVKAKPLEIHNHFESGSSSQVFNDKVHGKFEKLMKSGKSEKKEKSKKKRWKKIVRKML